MVLEAKSRKTDVCTSLRCCCIIVFRLDRRCIMSHQEKTFKTRQHGALVHDVCFFCLHGYSYSFVSARLYSIEYSVHRTEAGECCKFNGCRLFASPLRLRQTGLQTSPKILLTPLGLEHMCMPLSLYVTHSGSLFYVVNRFYHCQVPLDTPTAHTLEGQNDITTTPFKKFIEKPLACTLLYACDASNTTLAIRLVVHIFGYSLNVALRLSALDVFSLVPYVLPHRKRDFHLQPIDERRVSKQQAHNASGMSGTAGWRH